ncbi:MAG: hypothetical protein MUO40_14845 [Anaerolineaceae bacterium]|nr:hypothetical protein [Anaerolineaceae bacterium]
MATHKYFMLQDLKTSKLTYLGYSGYHYAISPDQERFAYIAGDYVIVASANGTWLQRFPSYEKWSGVIAWLNSGKLLIEESEWTPRNSGLLSSIIVLDLDSGKFETIYPIEFPSIVPNLYKNIGPEWLGKIVFLPNADLSYIVYATGYDEKSIALWDRVNQNEVVRINVFSNLDWGSLPEWSKNGDFFITSGIPEWDSNHLDYGPKDLLIVQTDGVIKNLTNLATSFETAERGYTLSPNDEKVAFWLATDFQSEYGPQTWQMAIIDLESGSLVTYCAYAGRTDWPIKPIWSPDGDKLLLTSWDDFNEYPSGVSIFDIENLSIIEISEDTVGVGWLHSVP